jgi:hypothetical protein
MEYFNLTPLLLLVTIFFLICAFLLMTFIKVKRSRIWFLIIAVVIIAGVKIHDRIINSVFYGFETEMCRTYSEIKNLELRIINGGSVCIIDVDLKEEIEAEEVENIFIEVLKRVNQDPMSSYLKGNSNRKNKHWCYLTINFFRVSQGRFESKLYQHSDWFTKENQQEQTWRNSDTGKEYHYSDYIE